MDATITHLAARLDKMAHLAGRVTAAFILMAGLPRVFHSGMYHFLASGLYGGHRGGGGGSGGGGGIGSDPKEWYDLHKAVMQDRRAERDEERSYYEQMKAEKAAESQEVSQRIEQAKADKASEIELEKAKWKEIHDENKRRREQDIRDEFALIKQLRKQDVDDQVAKAKSKVKEDPLVKEVKDAQLASRINDPIANHSVPDFEDLPAGVRGARYRAMALARKLPGMAVPLPPLLQLAQNAAFPVSNLAGGWMSTPGPGRQTMAGGTPGLPALLTDNIHPDTKLKQIELVGALALGKKGGRAQVQGPILDVAGAFNKLRDITSRLGYDLKIAFNWLRGRDVRGRPLSAEALASRREGLQGFQRGAVTAFLGGSALIGATAGAGAPDALGLLLNSFKLLAAQIGQTLVPYLVQAAVWVQNVFQGLREMDPALKSMLGGILFWGTAIAGGIVVFTKLWAVGSALVGIMKTLGLITTTVGASLLRMGIAGAVAYVAFELFRGLSRGAEMSKQRKLEEKRLSSQHEEKDLAEEAKNKDKAFKAFLDEGKRAEFAKELVIAKKQEQVARDRMEAAKERSDKSLLPWGEGLVGRGTTGRDIADFFTFGVLKNKVLPGEAYADAQANFATAKGRRLALEEAMGAKLKGKEGRLLSKEGVSFASSFLMGISSTKAQPQYGGIEDAYKKIQMEVLGKDPLTRMLDQINRESLLEMLKALRSIDKRNELQLDMYEEMLMMGRRRAETAP